MEDIQMKNKKNGMLLLGSLAITVTLSISACGNSALNTQKEHILKVLAQKRHRLPIAVKPMKYQC